MSTVDRAQQRQFDTAKIFARRRRSVGTDGPACNWRRPDAYGYMLVRRPEHPHGNKSGWVMEHRVVVEQALGHVLRSDAPVHHIDGNKANNHPSNLVACDSLGYHQVLHGHAAYPAMAGFDDSLRTLIEVEQYTLDDVALMFGGVSRERVRQWCAKRGIITHRPGRLTRRIWDDTRNRFVAIAYGTTERAAMARRAGERRKRSASTHNARGQLIRAALAKLRADLGREPAWSEFAHAVLGRGNCPYLIQFFSIGLGRMSMREKHAAFCREIGYEPRVIGARGHINPRTYQRAA